MKGNELPSYAELLDFYLKNKSAKRELSDYSKVSTEAHMFEREYHQQVCGNQKIRLLSIDLAVKNIELGSAFLFAKNIENYIIHGDIPEDVANKTPQEYFTRKDVEEIEEAHIKSEKDIADSKD